MRIDRKRGQRWRIAGSRMRDREKQRRKNCFRMD